MTGSLQVKNGKFYMVLNCKDHGKRKQKWLPTGLPERGNKRRAEQLLRETLLRYEQQSGLIPSDVAFAAYIRHWLDQVKRRVDPVTYQGYETLAQRHIIPYFEESGVKLTALTRQQLQVYLDEKGDHGRLDGKGGLSPRSLKLHKNILHQTLTEAVKEGLLSANPCDYIDLPSIPRYEATVYSAQQMQALFAASQGDPLEALIRVTAFYGLRRSEVLGLKWDSVDFDRGTLTIRHTVSKVTAVVEKDKTKNASSHRTFPLLPDLREVLLRVRAEEQEDRRLMGKGYRENGYLFKWPDGRPFSPDYVSQHFAALLAKHGLPPMRFHDLRHTCASLLLSRGMGLKDVQEWMGHADIKMTADIYGHLDIARKQTIADQMAAIL